MISIKNSQRKTLSFSALQVQNICERKGLKTDKKSRIQKFVRHPGRVSDIKLKSNYENMWAHTKLRHEEEKRQNGEKGGVR